MISHAALNASLNGTSAILLAGGYAAIRSGKIAVHKAFMISAFAVSSVFLVSYLLYHYRVGHVAFQGQGWIRPVYFTLLLTHTVLAIVIVPMILAVAQAIACVPLGVAHIAALSCERVTRSANLPPIHARRFQPQTAR